jgi:hypothetical protein
MTPRNMLGTQGEEDFNGLPFTGADGNCFNPFNPAGIIARHLPDIAYPWLRESRDRRHHRVAISSYQMAACNRQSFLRFVREKPTLLVADEVQMLYSSWEPASASEGWGEFFDEMAEACVQAGGLLLLMGGALFRHNGSCITRLPYVPGDPARLEDPDLLYPARDIIYTLPDGQAEHGLIGFDFDEYKGKVGFEANGKTYEKVLEQRDPAFEGRKLQTYLEDRRVWQPILDDMVVSWRHYNHEMHGYRSRLLTIAHNKHLARLHAAYLEKHHGIPMLLALDDEHRVHKAIDEFRHRRTPHQGIATCGMAYIGLSVRDLSHMAYLTTNRAMTYAIQAFNRVTRFDPAAPVPWEYQLARFFIPKDPKMIAIRNAMMAMQYPGVRGGEETSCGRKPPPPPPPPPPFMPKYGEITGRDFQTQENPIVHNSGVDYLVRAVPKLNLLTRSEVESVWLSARGQSANPDPPYTATHAEHGASEEEALRTQIQIIANEIDSRMARRYGKDRHPPGWCNGYLIRQFHKSRTEMGALELQAVLDFSEHYLRRLRAGDDLEESA